MSQPLDTNTDATAPSVQDDHAQVLEMLNSPQMQRRLEEARVQREKVLAEREAARKAQVASKPEAQAVPTPEPVRAAEAPAPSRPTAKDGSPSVGSGVVPLRPGGSGPALLVAHPSLRLAPAGAAGPAGVAAGSDPTRQGWRGSRALSLVVGLVSGLALGAGLMQLVDLAPSLLPGAPDLAETSARADPTGPEGDGGRTGAPAGSPAVDAAPLGPALVDSPRSDPSLVPAQADPPAAQTGHPSLGAPPVADAATAEARSATTPAGSQAEGAPLADLDWQVALHLPPDLSQDALHEAQQALRTVGVDLTGSSIASFGVAESEVRFFHGEDASDAAQIAEAMGARARDFSAYKPSPEPGTFEVWLAQEDAAASRPLD